MHEASLKASTYGGYELLRKLSSGGMGEVFIARKRGPAGYEKIVALKLIRRDLSTTDDQMEAARIMFLDEARLLGQLSHPAIANVIDFGEEEGTLYLALEYVAGISFRNLLGLRPPVPLILDAVAEAARGLHAAHEARDITGRPLDVVHRDVSPDNLMLGFDGQIKVLDFGIALVRGRSTVTEFGLLKGKPPYMSPEQVRNEPVTRKADIFSLAVVAHEMLTGFPVFGGASIYAIAHAIQHGEVPAPSLLMERDNLTKWQGIPKALWRVIDATIMKGLAKERDARFPTAEAFADALQRISERWPQREPLRVWVQDHLSTRRQDHQLFLSRVVRGDGAAEADEIARPSNMRTQLGAALAAKLASAHTNPYDAVTLGAGLAAKRAIDEAIMAQESLPAQAAPTPQAATRGVAPPGRRIAANTDRYEHYDAVACKTHRSMRVPRLSQELELLDDIALGDELIEEAPLLTSIGTNTAKVDAALPLDAPLRVIPQPPASDELAPLGALITNATKPSEARLQAARSTIPPRQRTPSKRRLHIAIGVTAAFTVGVVAASRLYTPRVTVAHDGRSPALTLPTTMLPAVVDSHEAAPREGLTASSAREAPATPAAPAKSPRSAPAISLAKEPAHVAERRNSEDHRDTMVAIGKTPAVPPPAAEAIPVATPADLDATPMPAARMTTTATPQPQPQPQPPTVHAPAPAEPTIPRAPDGRVRFVANPYAMVSVDGGPLTATNFARPMPAGLYRVEFRDPTTGRVLSNKTIEVRSNENILVQP